MKPAKHFKTLIMALAAATTLSAHAQSDGLVRVQASVTAPRTGHSVYVREAAEIRDVLTFSGDATSGAQGYVTFLVGMEFRHDFGLPNTEHSVSSTVALGSSSASASHYMWHFREVFKGGSYISKIEGYQRSCRADPLLMGDYCNAALQNVEPEGLQALTVPILFGQATDLRLSTSALLSATLSYSGTTVVAETDSLIWWGGIAKVTDSTGQAIDYTVSSLSGFDYRQGVTPPAAAVPEPASWLLLAAGLGIAGLGLRGGRKPPTMAAFHVGNA
jgi:hypothetical protein